MKGLAKDYLYVEKKSRRFTLDLTNWFAEGQTISFRFTRDKKSNYVSDAKIISVNDNGHIIFKNLFETYDVYYNDITEISITDRRKHNASNVIELALPNFFIYDDVYAFSLNAKDWYYEGQHIDLVTKRNIFLNAKISTINSGDFSDDKAITIRVGESLIDIPVDSIEDLSYKDRRIQIA